MCMYMCACVLFCFVFLQLNVVWHLMSFCTVRTYEATFIVNDDLLNVIMYKLVINKHESIFVLVFVGMVLVFSMKVVWVIEQCSGYGGGGD